MLVLHSKASRVLKLESLDTEPRAGGLGYVFGISLLTMNRTMTGEREMSKGGWFAFVCTYVVYLCLWTTERVHTKNDN